VSPEAAPAEPKTPTAPSLADPVIPKTPYTAPLRAEASPKRAAEDGSEELVLAPKAVGEGEDRKVFEVPEFSLPILIGSPSIFITP
jgi:hypothetical protein